MIADLPYAQGLVALLATLHPAEITVAPEGTTDEQGAPLVPYYVIDPWRIPLELTMAGAVLDDAELHYQVQCVGQRADQALALADAARAVIVGSAAFPDVGTNPPVAERRVEGTQPPVPSSDQRLVWVGIEVVLSVLS